MPLERILARLEATSGGSPLVVVMQPTDLGNLCHRPTIGVMMGLISGQSISSD